MNIRHLPPRPDAGVARSPILAGATLQAAFALLTRLPVHPAEEMTTGAAAFPIVGVVVGAVGAVPIGLLGTAQPVIASLLAVAAMTVLTGALHLDGLADTADALLAPNPTTAERARKDPAVGPGGAVALMLVMGIEVAALASLVSVAGWQIASAALLVAATVARTLPVLVVRLAANRVESVGLGAWFAARVGPVDAAIAAVLASLVTAAAAVVTGSLAVATGGVIGAGAGLVIAGVIVGGRRQLDGDGLGAVVELTLAASLATAAFVTAAFPS